ncbi:riboflavin synthase [Sphaerochaeta halotolerans]|jgi:riboflavin synthase|uniref:riboflavin synthase n=1 Tax=Sphaerochaeta halotolerans TaxID=2293840 RepID=UPI00136F6324|nr:riboflavin synthase [Sphaerochaeta halotolerans]MXI87089.1 riboflavin synthase [Sphaerochaeta halotolerans]
MFTGIIEELGSVVALHGKALSIHCHLVQEDLMIGDSIAVNGVCLTIINYSSQHIEAEVMPITLETTNLGSLKPGFMVNLERAIRLGGRLGGHLVSGHVDGTATILRLQQKQDAHLVTMEIPQELVPFVILKGSIAVDGISLTVAELSGNQVTVSLVGHTRKHTTLEGKRVGAIVNIECDQIGKYVNQLLVNQSTNKTKGSLDLAFLQKQGFSL